MARLKPRIPHCIGRPREVVRTPQACDVRKRKLPDTALSEHLRRLEEERAAHWLSALHVVVLRKLAGLVASGIADPSNCRIAAEASCSIE